MNRTKSIWLCLPAFLILAAMAPGSRALADGDEALLSFDALSFRLSGNQPTTLYLMYDGGSVSSSLRGFHVEVRYDDARVYVDSLDVHVSEGSFLSNIGPTAFYATASDDSTVVIDCAILGTTAGATGFGHLCSVTFKGRPTGDDDTMVRVTDATLRDPENHGIAYSAGVGVLTLDNTPPHVPTIDPEPEFTKGLSNYVSWSDESASGGVGYCCEVSDTIDFSYIVGTSYCTPFTYETFEGLTDGTLYYYRVRCRDDVWNVTENSVLVHSTQDDSPPVTAAGPLAAQYNTVMFSVPFSSFDATSGLDSVELYYQVNGGGYVRYGTSFTTSPISFLGPGEGIYEFYTVGVDNVGNVEGVPAQADCVTEVDLTPPPAPVDLVALPGHNCVSLSWDVTEARDTPIEGTLIVRKAWGTTAYPEYDDWGPSSGYPGHPADGVVIAFVPGVGHQTFHDTNLSDDERNIYYYTVFTRDVAGNYSAPAPSAQARATSYWLADVRESTGLPGAYDGVVDYYDKVAYSLCYYTSQGDLHYDAELDVGPTDDASRFGIPLTDNVIDFEDLMILAMNYGRVYPDCYHPDETGIPEMRSGDATLTLTTDGETVMPGDEVALCLSLLAEGSRVSGASTLLEFDPAALEFLSANAVGALSLTEEGFFYGSIETDNLIRVDAAALGPDAVLCGTYACVRFKVLSIEGTEVTPVEVDVRDASNRRIACSASGWTGVGETGNVPARLALRQNVPNPFNPSTEITFDIPERSPVTLRVYSASGRLVRTLVEDVRGGGAYRATWDGRDSTGADAPSGIYFYVLSCGGRRLTHKMALTR